MLKTRCIVAGYTLVIVPETVGSEQRGPVKDSRQRYSISGDRRADIKPKPANEHQQQPDIVAQVGKHPLLPWIHYYYYNMYRARKFLTIESFVVFVNREEISLRFVIVTRLNWLNFFPQRFPKLRIVHLESNELRRIPRELLELTGLTYLNLSDNKIEKIPADISQLIKYVESILSDFAWNRKQALVLRGSFPC